MTNETQLKTGKQFKRTQLECPKDYKILKAAQAKIVYDAIESLGTFTLKELDDKCSQLGLTTTSKKGIRMVADWYRRIFKEDGLVEEIKAEKPAKEPKAKPSKKSSDTKNQDTVLLSDIIKDTTKKFIKEKAKKSKGYTIKDKNTLTTIAEVSHK